MPELPEVQTVVSTLRPRITGARVSSVTLLRPDILRPAGLDLDRVVRGQTVRSIRRRGKKILIQFDNGTLCFHLGMTGRLIVQPADAPVIAHTHLLVDFSPRCQLRFCDPRRFGGVWWLVPGERADENLGPEPLTVKPAELARRLAKTRRAIKTALLDQSLIAGLGNIYVDESLFGARIHPLTPANKLTSAEVARLGRSIKSILRRAIRLRGSSVRNYVDANGDSGAFQKLHRVYAREGAPCARCGRPIQRMVLGGRSTHFCAQCQRR